MPYNLDIPGWMLEQDLNVIQQLAKKVPPGGIILEVGAFLGRSTWAWAKSCDPSVTVYVVDNWSWMPNEQQYGPGLPGYPLDRDKTPEELFQHYTADCPNIKSFKGNSWDVEIPEIKERGGADLIFFDAGHGEMDIRRDIMHWLPYADANKTILCGDDYWEGDENQPPVWPGIVGCIQWVSKFRMKRPVLSIGAKLWCISPASIV